jgi:hypothetical protein
VRRASSNALAPGAPPSGVQRRGSSASQALLRPSGLGSRPGCATGLGKSGRRPPPGPSARRHLPEPVHGGEKCDFHARAAHGPAIDGRSASGAWPRR